MACSSVGSCPQKSFIMSEIFHNFALSFVFNCATSCIFLAQHHPAASPQHPSSISGCLQKWKSWVSSSLLTFLMRHKNTYLHTEDFKVAFFSNASNHNWCIMMQINCCLRLGTLLKIKSVSSLHWKTSQLGSLQRKLLAFTDRRQIKNQQRRLLAPLVCRGLMLSPFADLGW